MIYTVGVNKTLTQSPVWYCYGTAAVLFRYCCGIVLVLLRYCCGTATVLLRYHYGTVGVGFGSVRFSSRLPFITCIRSHARASCR